MRAREIETRQLVGSLCLMASLVSTSEALASNSKQFRVNYGWDGTVTGIALAGGILFNLTPVDSKRRWENEPFPFDEGVKGNFSIRASNLSDILLFSTIIVPLVGQLNSGVDEQLGQTSLLYTEALGAAFLLNTASKYLVQRPRPYVYNNHPQVVAYAAGQGKDTHLSFFSGHTTMAFAAAVAGSYLFASSTQDRRAGAILWGVELAMATATANLRVRAGKHFYSDVLVGALVGSGVGLLVPLLHQKKGTSYSPEPLEWTAMGAGILAGALASQLLPLTNDVTIPLTASADGTVSYRLTPMATEQGAGLMLVGNF